MAQRMIMQITQELAPPVLLIAKFDLSHNTMKSILQEYNQHSNSELLVDPANQLVMFECVSHDYISVIGHKQPIMQLIGLVADHGEDGLIDCYAYDPLIEFSKNRREA